MTQHDHKQTDLCVRLTENCFLFIYPLENQKVRVCVERISQDKTETLSESTLGAGVVAAYAQAFALIAHLMIAKEPERENA